MTTTLLAVDDSVTMRKVLEITFAGENFKTVLASSGQEALNLAKSERPTLVLLDHTLPDMSGYDLCLQLKAVAPGAAVLIMSSKSAPYDKARGTASGVDDFMDKPFDTQKLLDKVGQVLSQPRAAAGSPAAHQVAPVATAAAEAARPRSPTLAYGTAVPPGGHAPSPATPAPASVAVTRTLGGGTTATPRPAVAAAGPRLAQAAPAPVTQQAAPAPAARTAPAAVAVASAVAAAGNGQLTGKLEAMGLTPSQVDGVLALSREVVEKIVWEVVPVLAETIIKEELRRLTSE